MICGMGKAFDTLFAMKSCAGETEGYHVIFNGGRGSRVIVALWLAQLGSACS